MADVSHVCQFCKINPAGSGTVEFLPGLCWQDLTLSAESRVSSVYHNSPHSAQGALAIRRSGEIPDCQTEES